MIKIYGKKKSRTIRCLWALEELGLAYEHIPIDQEAGENHSPAYLALNPAGKVPTLVEGDFVLTESMAINLYLASREPGKLLPAEPHKMAKVLQWTLWAASEAEFQLITILKEFRRGEGQADQERVNAALAALGTTIKVLEGHLSEGGPYLLGNEFTMADLNTAAVLCYLGMMGFKIHSYPASAAWLERCLERPAWRKLQT